MFQYVFTIFMEPSTEQKTDTAVYFNLAIFISIISISGYYQQETKKYLETKDLIKEQKTFCILSMWLYFTMERTLLCLILEGRESNVGKKWKLQIFEKKPLKFI